MRDHDKTRVLVVEDEPITCKRLSATLKHYGYQVLAAATASAALTGLRDFAPHIVLLDILLPDSSDFSLAEQIARRNGCGLIITSAFDRREDRLSGLRAGADDYLTKPYDMDELLLKLERLADRIRRSEVPAADIREQFELDTCTFDPARSLIVRRDGRTIHLTSRERVLLGLFVTHPGRLFSRAQLIEALEPGGSDVYDRAIDSCISRLRRKIEPDPKAPEILKSIYGEGYILNSSVRRMALPDD
jgi:two-component system, OmpR family, response regulator